MEKQECKHKKCFFSFLRFDCFVTPALIKVVFWFASIVFFASGMLDVFHGLILPGLITMILGPILARVVAECILVFFQINSNLNKLSDKN